MAVSIEPYSLGSIFGLLFWGNSHMLPCMSHMSGNPKSMQNTRQLGSSFRFLGSCFAKTFEVQVDTKGSPTTGLAMSGLSNFVPQLLLYQHFLN